MNSSLSSPLQYPQSQIRIGYVGSAFPLAYEKIGGELSGIHVELWQTALKGRTIQWEKRTVYGQHYIIDSTTNLYFSHRSCSYEPYESGFFDGMLGEMQKGTLDIALQESCCFCCSSISFHNSKHYPSQDFSYRKARMDELYYTLPVEEWEENLYESQEIFFEPAIVVVPFSTSFTAILLALFIAMSLTEVAVRAVISKLRGKTDTFWISCNSMTILGALFHRLAIIFILIIYNAAFVGLATSPGIEPTRSISTVIPLLRQGKITLVVNYEDSIKQSVLDELFNGYPRGDWKKYRAIADIEEKQNVLCHNPNAIFFGRLYSITHNDPDTPYKHQCAFKMYHAFQMLSKLNVLVSALIVWKREEGKSVDPTDVSFLPNDSEIIKLGIGKKFLTTFHMSRNVSRAIRERFSFVQLALFDRDMIDNFWWRRYTNQPRIIREKSPPAFYQSIGLTAFETIFIVFGSLTLLAILIFIVEIVYAKFFPKTDPRVKRGCRFIGYIL